MELDAESQVEASQLMEQRGQVPVGWYHSHPVFEARPSQKGVLAGWLAAAAACRGLMGGAVALGDWLARSSSAF